MSVCPLIGWDSYTRHSFGLTLLRPLKREHYIVTKQFWINKYTNSILMQTNLVRLEPPNSSFTMLRARIHLINVLIGTGQLNQIMLLTVCLPYLPLTLLCYCILLVYVFYIIAFDSCQTYLSWNQIRGFRCFLG